MDRPLQWSLCQFDLATDWTQFYLEANVLMFRHYNELSREPDQDLWSPDHELYTRLMAEGRLVIMVARVEGKLVGYHMMILVRHPHYRKLIAYDDTEYLHPAQRHGWTGYKMIKAMVQELKSRGVAEIYLHEKAHWASNKGRTLGTMYERLGAVPSDRIWLLKVGG